MIKTICAKKLFEEKDGSKTRVNSFKCIFRKSEDIASAIY